MAVLPLKETINVYNRNQQCSRTEQLRDPAVAADYSINKGDFINKDLLNVIFESEGVIAKQGLTIGASGINVVINPGYGIFRNFIFSIPSLTNIDATAMPNGSTWSLILKVVEKRFTSGATSGGSETDDNALEGTPGTNPYGNLWPQVTSGYDPNNCLQVAINTVAFDVSNEWRYKYSFQLVSTVPSNENPIAATSINRFYVEIASVIKDASGNLTVIDKIFTNSVAYRNRSNYFFNSNQMAPSPMNIIQKSQIIGGGTVTDFILSPSGNSDTYILDLDNASTLSGYNPLSGFVVPGIDAINILPNGGNGHRFKLIIKTTNPSKKLNISFTVGPTVDTAYNLSYQLPQADANKRISLANGSVTSFCIYNNILYIEDALNHLTQNVYGDTNYSNTTFYPTYTTHKAALDALANQIVLTAPGGVALSGIVLNNVGGISSSNHRYFKVGNLLTVNFNLRFTAYNATAGSGVIDFNVPGGYIPVYDVTTFALANGMAMFSDGTVGTCDFLRAGSNPAKIRMGFLPLNSTTLTMTNLDVYIRFCISYKIN